MPVVLGAAGLGGGAAIAPVAAAVALVLTAQAVAGRARHLAAAAPDGVVHVEAVLVDGVAVRDVGRKKPVVEKRKKTLINGTAEK